MVKPIEHLTAFQLEGAGSVLARPATGDTDVHVLIEQHLAIGADVAEIHRAVPWLVPVHRIIATVARDAVLAFNVNAPHRVIEETVVADNGDDGDGVVLVVLDIAARHRSARQIAVLKKTEHIARGTPYGELARGASFSRTISLHRTHRQTAIGGVHQYGTIGNIYIDVEKLVKQTTAYTHCGWV